MDSILKQELIELKGSINYWLVVGWVIAILISLIAIITVLYSNRNKQRISTVNQIIDKKNISKGFKIKQD